MTQNFNIIIIRHFKTVNDKKNKEEKIIYKDAFEQSKPFIKFIKKYVDKYNKINKIKFISSPQDRTIMTGLIISTILKSDIIENRIKKIIIEDPIIEEVIDRDPHKKKHIITCKVLKEQISKEYDENTLYIFITHSSLIYNTFSCLLNSYLKDKIEFFAEKIHSYSLSYIIKSNNKISYEFNKNLKN